jgi:hypothetical protein
MNLKLTLTLTLALALAPLLAVHHGFRPDLRAPSGWQDQGEAVPSAQGLRFDCVATGADLLRRAAPAVIGETPNPSWTPPQVGLNSAGKLVCLDS